MYEAPALVQLADQQLTAAEKVDQMVLVQRDSGGDIAEKVFAQKEITNYRNTTSSSIMIVSWRGPIGATRRAIIYRNERRAADEPGDL